MQLDVTSFIVPAENWHAILWLEQVTIGGVVQNDNVFHRSPESGHVFDKHTIVESAVLPK